MRNSESPRPHGPLPKSVPLTILPRRRHKQTRLHGSGWNFGPTPLTSFPTLGLSESVLVPALYYQYRIEKRYTRDTSQHVRPYVLPYLHVGRTCTYPGRRIRPVPWEYSVSPHLPRRSDTGTTLISSGVGGPTETREVWVDGSEGENLKLLGVESKVGSQKFQSPLLSFPQDLCLPKRKKGT